MFNFNLYKNNIFLNIMKLKGNKGIIIKVTSLLRDDLYNIFFIKKLMLYRDSSYTLIHFHMDMDHFCLLFCQQHMVHSLHL